MEKWLIREAHNLEIMGSNPICATNCENTAVARWYLSSDMIGGSIPLLATTTPKGEPLDFATQQRFRELSNA